MQPLPRAERIAVWIWVILAVVAWNGIYDVLLSRAAKDYLFRAALHEAGQGPLVPMTLMLDVAVRDASWIATLWASIILLAGLITVRIMRTSGPRAATSNHAQADL
jgi:hypothetical protein